MSLDDDDFLVKMQVKLSKMTAFQRRKLLNEFEIWRATAASMGGVGSVLMWVAWVAYWHGWCDIVDVVGGVGDMLA